jgi:hypothetical protein
VNVPNVEIRVTKLGNCLPVRLLLEACYDKKIVAQRNGDILGTLKWFEVGRCFGILK